MFRPVRSSIRSLACSEFLVCFLFPNKQCDKSVGFDSKRQSLVQLRVTLETKS